MANNRQVSTTGTTSASYVATNTSCGDYRATTIMLKNTHATATMYYKLWGYAVNGGTSYRELVGETSLAAGAAIDFENTQEAYGNIAVLVKNNSAACTYLLEYCNKN